MKIKYEFLTGEIIEIEVPDGFGEVSIAIDKEIHNSDRRETRRHNYISEMEERGLQFPDNRQDVPDIFKRQQMSEALHSAFDKLLSRQKELVFSVFYEQRSITDIAREEGVSESAVRNRLRKIYKKLKTFLD